MTNYRVFCADCHSSYEQGGRRPFCCGLCGSDFIAVKVANIADSLDLSDDYPASPNTSAGMYE